MFTADIERVSCHFLQHQLVMVVMGLMTSQLLLGKKEILEQKGGCGRRQIVNKRLINSETQTASRGDYFSGDYKMPDV